MAKTVTLAPLTSLTNDTSAIATINSNSQLIETAFADCLSLSGSSPNAMQNNLDMNNNQILNLPSPATINSPARLIDIVANPTLALTIPPVGTSGATVPLLNTNVTFSGTNTYTALQTFNGAFNATGDFFSLIGLTTDPKLILYSGITLPPGSSNGGGVLFNCNNSAGTNVTAAFVNGGYKDNTAGAERGDIDLAIWDGANLVYRTLAIFCDGTQAIFGPDVDNYYQLGLSGFKWKNINTVLITATGAISFGSLSGTGFSVSGSGATATTGIVNTGTISSTSSILSSGSTGVGYKTGAGGTVAQATNKSTGVTINKITGQITMNNAALANSTTPTTGIATFVVTNSTVAGTDTVTACISGGTSSLYNCYVTNVAASSFWITVQNISGGSLSEALVVNFNVIKGAAS